MSSYGAAGETKFSTGKDPPKKCNIINSYSHKKHTATITTRYERYAGYIHIYIIYICCIYIYILSYGAALETKFSIA